MHDVFISYSSKDYNVAKAVCHRLEENNIRCWIAPRDIKPGDIWADAINHAIKHSKVFVLIFSKNSNSSNQVSKELTLAVNSHLMIFPLKIAEVLPTGAFEYYLSDTHWLDAINEPLDNSIAHMNDVISTYLNTNNSHQLQHDYSEHKGKPSNSKYTEFVKKILIIVGIIFLIASIVIFLAFAVMDIGYDNHSLFVPYYEWFLGAYSIYMILALIGYVRPKVLLCKSRKQVTVFFMLPFILLAIVGGNVMEEYENIYKNNYYEASLSPNNTFLDIQIDKRMSYVYYGNPKVVTESSSNMPSSIVICFDTLGRVTSKEYGNIKNVYVWNADENTIECKGYKDGKYTGAAIIFIKEMSDDKYVYEVNGTHFEVHFRENGSLNKMTASNNGQSMITTYYYQAQSDKFPHKVVAKGVGGQSLTSIFSNIEKDSIGNVIKVFQTSMGQSAECTTNIEYYNSK